MDRKLVEVKQWVIFTGTGARKIVFKLLSECKDKNEAMNRLQEEHNLEFQEAYLIVNNFENRINTKNYED